MSLFHALQTRKARVLFVCLGNAVRSQMAEAFCRAYGSDVAEVDSAGLTPARKIPSMTYQVMEEKSISLEGQVPTSLSRLDLSRYDVVVNMSGYALPKLPGIEVKLVIRDPLGKDGNSYRSVRDSIERHVALLIEHFRAARALETAAPVRDLEAAA